MNKLSKILVLNILLLLVVGGFTGCGSTEDNTTAKNTKPAENKNTTTVSETNKKPEDAKPADNSKTDSTDKKSEEVSATGDKIGVPECDEYIAKYEACVNKNVPDAMRATFKTSFEQSRKAWKQAAANPTSKANLASACKQATETAKQAMASYKCDF